MFTCDGSLPLRLPASAAAGVRSISVGCLFQPVFRKDLVELFAHLRSMKIALFSSSFNYC